MQGHVTVDDSVFIIQRWSEYTSEQHDVWRTLFERRMRELEHTASNVFLEGARRIGLVPDGVPDLAEVNQRLDRLTGWRAVPVSGFIPGQQFFQCLSRRLFPTTVTLRPREQLEYLEEPDIFHDVFGHVPLHADPVFADFLERFGSLAMQAETDEEMERMARLFWFTVEFGLIREDNEIKVYGSGLISSSADSANALGPNCSRRPFSLDEIYTTPFRIDRLQETLFVIDSFDELFEVVEGG